VNVTSAIFTGLMPCAESRIICARRQVTTDPDDRRTIRNSFCPRPGRSPGLAPAPPQSDLHAYRRRSRCRHAATDRANLGGYGTRNGSAYR
jgi:hypothetical protein